MDRRAFERLLKEGRARGFAVGDVEGALHYKGCDVQYRYDPEQCALEVCLVKKPALLPAAVVWAMLERVAARYKAGEFDPTSEGRSHANAGTSNRGTGRRPRRATKPAPRNLRRT